MTKCRECKYIQCTEFEDVCRLHFTDSISGCKYFDFSPKGLSLIDIGTGAGFPGIPLKIVFPDLNVTLIDSLQKRLNFLDEVISTLDLNSRGSIRTLHGRAALHRTRAHPHPDDKRNIEGELY